MEDRDRFGGRRSLRMRIGAREMAEQRAVRLAVGDADSGRCVTHGSGATGVTSVANEWSCSSRAIATRSATAKCAGV